MKSPSIFPEQAKPWPQAKATTQGVLDPHQQYWYLTVGRALTAFLVNAGYSHEDQVSILHHFAKIVTPYLGVAPPSGLPRWKSFMTDNHTPIELSWDFHTGVEQPTIRYSMEPIGLDAGTAANQHNNRASTDFKQCLTRAFPAMDTTLFDHFQAVFQSRRYDNKGSEDHPSTLFWAFDLKEGEIMNKAYFFPSAAASATNQSAMAVISDAIKSAPGWSSETSRSFDTFVDYVNEHPELSLEIDMVSLDLVHIDMSRLKIYFRDRRTNFRAVHDTMSLGGRATDPNFEEGIQKLRRLWDALLGTHNVADDVPLPYKYHRTAGILYNVEFRIHSETPKVKVYIPVRHYAKSDQHIVTSLTGFWAEEARKRRDGWKAPAYKERYSECLRNTFDSETLSTYLGVHTYIGCSLQSGGTLRVVSYINPNPGSGS